MLSQKRKRSKSTSNTFTSEERAILTTIIYADIFKFPLTKQELWKYLISDKRVSQKDFAAALHNVKSFILEQDNFLALKNRYGIIKTRKENIIEVERKTAIAVSTARILSSIPTITFIGISGGLAAKNVKVDDDIDLFIITKQRRIFTTRILILMYLSLLGKRRSRLSGKTKDMICVNLLIDETAISWPEQKRDIYIAREIAQVVPLYSINNAYKNFLKENNWISQFLPNALSENKVFNTLASSNFLKSIGRTLTYLPIETLSRIFQVFIMRKHITRETVTNSQLAFHPRDYRAETLTQLKLKMRQLGLLTNP